MTVGSLFAGIGGFDLAATRVFGLGSVRWQVEIDPWCRRVLAKHWPDVPKFGDIRELTGDELEPVDVVCGGFPCQPVSLAGSKQAEADWRWLWPHFARLLAVLRPRYVIVENTNGLLYRGMGSVLGALAGIGFDAEWSLFPACALGAPHARQRVFIVAYPHGKRLQAGGTGGGVGVPRLASSELRQAAPISSDRARSDWLATEPRVGRVADGVPHRVDRLRGLGNAIVPQVAEFLFRQIEAAEGVPA